MEIFHAKSYTSVHQYFNEEGNTQTKNDYYEGGRYGLIIHKTEECYQVIVSELPNNTGCTLKGSMKNILCKWPPH